MVPTSGNTTNLHSHLGNHHPEVVIEKLKANPVSRKRTNTNTESEPAKKSREVEETIILENEKNSSVKDKELTDSLAKRKQQLKVNVMLRDQKSFTVNGSKYCQAVNRLIYMVCIDKMPYSIVEKKGFNKFVSFLNPFFKLPDRKTFTNMISAKYVALREVVKIKLKNLEHMALTCDIWTDTHNTQSYLGLTTHFIDQESYSFIMVGVMELDTNHTAVNIQTWLEQMLLIWSINKCQVVVVAADNASNIKKAIIDLFGKEKYLACFAHTLNLCVTDVLQNKIKFPDVLEAVEKVKSIVTFFHQSVTAADLLRKHTNLKLHQSNNTRWHSTFLMLERYLDLKDPVSSILINLASDKVPIPIMGEDLSTISELVRMLKPFKQASDYLCGDKYVTGSDALPMIKNLRQCFLSIESSTKLSQLIQNGLKESFDSRFRTLEYYYPISIANLLDPRYKKMYFSDSVAYAKNTQKISSLIKEMQREEAENAPEEEPVDIQNSNHEGDDIWAFDKSLRNQLRSTAIRLSRETSEGLPVELSYYLSQPVAEISDNPIKYWCSKKDSLLAKIALKYLTVISTSVPSERQFSHAALVLTNKRSSLTPEHFQELLFLSTLPDEYWPFDY